MQALLCRNTQNEVPEAARHSLQRTTSYQKPSAMASLSKQFPLLSQKEAHDYAQHCQHILDDVTGPDLASVMPMFDKHGFAVLRNVIDNNEATLLRGQGESAMNSLQAIGKVTSIVNEQPFATDEENAKHAANTSLRTQCILPSSTLLEKASRTLDNVLSCQLIDPTAGKWSQFRVLESQPLNTRQVSHVDDEARPNSLSVIIALCDEGANFGMVAGSHRGNDCSLWTSLNVCIRKGDCIVFRLTTTHQGGAYASRNVRLHGYFFLDPTPSAVPKDPRPNAATDVFNGEREARCTQRAIFKQARPSPISGLRNVVGSSPGVNAIPDGVVSPPKSPQRDPQSLLERKRRMRTGYLPVHCIRPGVDGRTPSAMQVRDLVIDMASRGFDVGQPLILCLRDLDTNVASILEAWSKTVDGFHRFMSALISGLQVVPVLVLDEVLSPTQCCGFSWQIHESAVNPRQTTILDAFRAYFEAFLANPRWRTTGVEISELTGFMHDTFKSQANARNLAMPVAKRLVAFWYRQEDRRGVVDQFFALASELRPAVVETLVARTSWIKIINLADCDDMLVNIVHILARLFGEARQCDDRGQPVRRITDDTIKRALKINHDIEVAKESRKRKKAPRSNKTVDDTANDDERRDFAEDRCKADLNENENAEKGSTTCQRRRTAENTSPATASRVPKSRALTAKKTPALIPARATVLTPSPLPTNPLPTPGLSSTQNQAPAAAVDKALTPPRTPISPALTLATTPTRTSRRVSVPVQSQMSFEVPFQAPIEKVSLTPKEVTNPLLSGRTQTAGTTAVLPGRGLQRQLASMGATIPWTVSLCRPGTDGCLANNTHRRLLTSGTPVSGTFLIGESASGAASAPRCTKLEDLSAVCGVDVYFQVNACCYRALSSVALLFGPAAHELASRAANPLLFWNFLVASGCVHYKA